MLIVKGRGAAAMFLPELRGRMVYLYQIVFSGCEELSSGKLDPEACSRYVEIKERAHVSGFDFVVPRSLVAGIHFVFLVIVRGLYSLMFLNFNNHVLQYP